MKINLASMTLAEINELRTQLYQAGFRNNNVWNGSGRPPQFDYSSLDWSKSNAALSRETGIGIGTLYQWRTKLNKPQAEFDREPGPTAGVVVKSIRADHALIDWTKPDIEISKEHGFTREYARQLRAKYGKPRVYVARRRYEEFLKTFEGVKELQFEDAAQKFSISYDTFRKYCAQAGIKVIPKNSGLPTKYDWNSFDWDLPNRLLTEIWGMKFNAVASYRYRNRIHGAKFSSWFIPDEFQAAVAEQKAKAAEFKATGKLTTNHHEPEPEPTE